MHYCHPRSAKRIIQRNPLKQLLNIKIVNILIPIPSNLHRFYAVGKIRFPYRPVLVHPLLYIGNGFPYALLSIHQCITLRQRLPPVHMHNVYYLQIPTKPNFITGRLNHRNEPAILNSAVHLFFVTVYDQRCLIPHFTVIRKFQLFGQLVTQKHPEDFLCIFCEPRLLHYLNLLIYRCGRNRDRIRQPEIFICIL